MKYIILLILLTGCYPTNPGSYYKAERGWINQNLQKWDVSDPDTTIMYETYPIIEIIKNKKDER